MRRVLVIGCPGAGKSTFSRKLAAVTSLPLHYLDMLWHKADRSTVSREGFDASLDELLRTDSWIVDGNYLRTLPRRLAECDTVFFFDLPTDVCLSGAKERIGKPREDMPWIETGLDEEFRQWILDFPKDQLPEILRCLDAFKGTVYHFRSREEADSFVESL